jgi:type IV pilus assembly protein PilO
MALPKLSDLSPGVQAVVVVLAGVLVAGGGEYVFLQPVKDANTAKQAQVTSLTAEVTPLRPFRERLRILEADNKQLENQLATLQKIVPSEKEVDNFMRLVQNEASTAGVTVRRYTSKTAIPSQYYVEVPFEIELDGSYYDVMQFYERLGRVERITNVTDLRLGGIGNNKKYPSSPSTTISAVCTVTTFFSRDEGAAAPAPGAPGAAPAAAGR